MAGISIQRVVGNIITLTIANGDSVSDVADIGSRKVVGLITPAAWTAAVLTFDANPSGANFRNVYDDGTERSIANATMQNASVYLSLDARDWESMGLIRVKSGTQASAVVQGADRTIKLVIGGAL